MRHEKNACILLAILLLFSSVPAFAQNAESPAIYGSYAWKDETVSRVDGSFVSYPLFYAENAEAGALVNQLNACIQETARIPAYLQVLSSLQPGGAGLRMNYQTSCPYAWSEEMNARFSAPYLSLLFSAEGKMPLGRPSQAYHPITLDMATGEMVAFEALFTDPEGAKAYIEACLEENVEPILSTYLENSQLFPVPYDRFFLDGKGNIIIYYENSQLSFLSGYSGAVAFRYSELWDWLDTSPAGVAMQVLTNDRYGKGLENWEGPWLTTDGLYGFASLSQGFDMDAYLGMPLAEVLAMYRQAADSEYYPNGACVEVEEAVLRGTLLLTDEAETILTGVLAHRVDHFGIETGKTSLSDAEALIGGEPDARIPLNEAAAEMYRVCPGTASVYSYEDTDGQRLSFTLYADENGIVQYLKLSLD